jgi:hypothetical protein
MISAFRFSMSSLIVSLASVGVSQQWADKMFEVKTHDFGTVARAAKAEFDFPLKNLYKEDIHIATVRASCGCTTPIIEKQTLKTGEIGHIKARFNTDTFYGKKGATLTVVIDRPYPAEVQLRVDGYIRRDVVFNPGQIEFGQVDHGSPITKTVAVAYAGRDSWAIADVKSSLPFVNVQRREISRGPGRVNYELDVTVSDEAPVGFCQDNLILMTNDTNMPQIPLLMTADITSPVSVTPSSLMIGDVKPGEVIEKRLVIKAKAPFKVSEVRCEGFDCQVEGGEEGKALQVVTVRLVPRADGAARVNGNVPLVITTDLSGDPHITATVMGRIVTGG